MSTQQLNNLTYAKLFKYSIAMVILPLVTLAFTYHFTVPYFLGPTTSVDLRANISAIAAVIAVNVVIAAYVISAFREKDDVPPSTKSNKSD